MGNFLRSFDIDKFLHSGIRKDFKNFSLPAWSIPILLLGLCVAAYGLLTPWAAIAFTLYPGFDQQPIAVVYSYVFLILIAFLLSFTLTLLAVRRPKWFWLDMLA